LTEYKVALIVGSLRRDSFNRRLGHAVAKTVGTRLLVPWVRLDDLLLYNQDDENAPVKVVLRLKKEITAEHGSYLSPPSTTGPSPVYSKTRSTTRRVRTVKAFGRGTKWQRQVWARAGDSRCSNLWFVRCSLLSSLAPRAAGQANFTKWIAPQTGTSDMENRRCILSVKESGLPTT